jgi:glycosyltransferase involved in cell wall biosynthesis
VTLPVGAASGASGTFLRRGGHGYDDDATDFTAAGITVRRLMRLLYVVQRYGEEIAGGAEQHCRDFAERLVERGHDVTVATSCARSYSDWADEFPPGPSELHGVVVNRFPVARPRDRASFDEQTTRLVLDPRERRPGAVRDWLRAQGPELPELVPWLAEHVGAYDRAIFFTYLYWPTWSGLRAVAGVIPTVLHPTVHDEPVLAFPVYDEVFRLPDAFAFSTPEEIDLVRARFGFEPAGAVVGIGTDLAVPAPAAFLDDPYLCYVGRVDEGKGARELFDTFAQYKATRRGPLNLVFVGEAQFALPKRDDVIVTGFVDEATRDAAISNAVALVQPSRYESFSMVVTEAMARSRPVLVRADCAVTHGHVVRSGGGFAYSGVDDFAKHVDRLLGEPGLAEELGARGRAYVEAEYAWTVVLDRYEQLLDEVTATVVARGAAGRE